MSDLGLNQAFPTNQSYQIEIEVIKPKTLTMFKEVKITISTFFSNFAFDSVIRAFLLLKVDGQEETDD